jgi:hypothetical protein
VLCRSVVVLGEPLLDFEAVESNCSGGRAVIRQFTVTDTPPYPGPRHVPPSSYISHRQHRGFKCIQAAGITIEPAARQHYFPLLKGMLVTRPVGVPCRLYFQGRKETPA